MGIVAEAEECLAVMDASQGIPPAEDVSRLVRGLLAEVAVHARALELMAARALGVAVERDILRASIESARASGDVPADPDCVNCYGSGREGEVHEGANITVLCGCLTGFARAATTQGADSQEGAF